MFELESAIAEWRRHMLVNGVKTPAPLEELEGHLRDEIESLTQSGLDESQAFATARERIGPARAVRAEFEKVATSRRFLHALVAILAISIVSGVGWMAFFPASLAIRVMLGLGLGIELPLVLLVLARDGSLDYQRAVGWRPAAMVWNFVLGVMLTTPEIIPQITLAMFLQLFYEAGIHIIRHEERQQNKAAVT